MPGYVQTLLQKYKHSMLTKPQHRPYAPAPKQFGAKKQALLLVDISPSLLPDKIMQFSTSLEASHITPERLIYPSSWH
jgi:hypothetical protein